MWYLYLRILGMGNVGECLFLFHDHLCFRCKSYIYTQRLLKAPFFVLNFCCYKLITFLFMLFVILLSMLMIMHFLKCDQASDFRKQLELDSELEFDLCNTAHCGRKWLFNFSDGKTELASFDWSNNIVPLTWKWMGLVLKQIMF